MPTEILATGTTEASSSDVTVTSGTFKTISLKDAAGPSVNGAVVLIEIKDDAGQYFTVDHLDGNKPAVAIVAPGTYRARRLAGPSCGVFSD